MLMSILNLVVLSTLICAAPRPGTETSNMESTPVCQDDNFQQIIPCLQNESSKTLEKLSSDQNTVENNEPRLTANEMLRKIRSNSEINLDLKGYRKLRELIKHHHQLQALRILLTESCELQEAIQVWEEVKKEFSHLPRFTVYYNQLPFFVYLALNNYPLAEHLLEKGADINEADDLGITALMRAASNNDHLLIYNLCRKGASVDLQDNHGNTALSHAASFGQFEATFTLLLAKANPNTVSMYGWTPLMLVVSRNHQKIILTLLDSKANVDAKKLDGMTALMIAADMGYIEATKLLISHNATVDSKTGALTTALMYAAQKNHIEVAEILLEAGAQVDVYNGLHLTAADMAAEYGHYRLAAMIQSYSVSHHPMNKR